MERPLYYCMQSCSRWDLISQGSIGRAGRVISPINAAATFQPGESQCMSV